MNCYKIKYSKKAKKFLKSNRIAGIRFFKAFEEIAQDKNNLALYDIKRLKGTMNNLFRMRIGKYRAIFKVEDNEITIYVLNIDSRGDIYK